MNSPTLVLALTTLSTFLTFVNISAYTVMFAPFASSFGLSAAMVGTLIGISGLSRVFLDLPAGLVLDRIGRRIPALIGATIFSAGALILAISTDVYHLIIFQVLQGLGQMFTVVASIALVADSSPPGKSGRYMSLWQTGLSLGETVGPIVGGLLATIYNYRVAFWLNLVVSLAPMAIFAFGLPSKTRPERVPGGLWRDGWATIFRLLQNRRVLAGCFTSFASFFAYQAVRSTILPLYSTRGLFLSLASVGTLLTLSSIVNVMALIPSGVLSDKLGRGTMIVAGLSLQAVSAVGYAVSGDFLTLIFPSLIFGVGNALVGPSRIVIVTESAKPEERGMALGAYRTFQSLAFLFGPLAAGLLIEFVSFSAALGAIVAVCAVAAGTIFAIIER